MGLFMKILLSAALVNFCSKGSRVLSGPVVIQGTVVDSHSGQPLSKAYLYIISGEEEAMTDAAGRFSISTWQPFPVTVTATYPGYVKTGVRVENKDTRPTIRMVPETK